MSKTLILQGFFISCDLYNRAKIMFLDDYDLIDKTYKNKITFTKSYITKKSNIDNGKSPITDNNTSFYVKYTKKNIGTISGKPVPLLDLKQHKVELLVNVSHYNFTKMNNVIRGWNIKLLQMNLIEM
jgi:hypothetical protein